MQIGQIKKAERICRESNFYDPKRVKTYFKKAKLTNQMQSLIISNK